MIPQPTLIFHITHVNNLPLILAAGGLRTCQDLRNANVGYTDVAYQTPQDRRASVNVPCGPGGTLHHYVPFYFAPRSPMLYGFFPWRLVVSIGVAGPRMKARVEELLQDAEQRPLVNTKPDWYY